ncbi:hypothetical protein B0J17DRAFT_723068 [Rhizoctonia solani]|nr:hypothetical protein B0J17DRAFT_723068 [Rhizoctonia solani]
MVPRVDSQDNQGWGRSLEYYVTSYDIAAARGRGLVPREVEEEAQLFKEAMYGQVLNAHGSVPGAGNFLGVNDVTLPMLETVLKPFHSPHHLPFFADQVFIAGCIRFFAHIRPEGKPSPFSHELGYLCFRIIAVGIGAWILKVTKNLDVTMQDMQASLGTEPLLVFSRHVCRALMDAIAEVGPTACDWIMGWKKTRGHRNPERFILPADLRCLLSTLWEDRQLYLRALLTTYFPALSGVVFVLWRYLDVNPVTEANRPTELMVVPFCELLWRSILVATEDQLPLLRYINNVVYRDKQVEL